MKIWINHCLVNHGPPSEQGGRCPNDAIPVGCTSSSGSTRMHTAVVNPISSPIANVCHSTMKDLTRRRNRNAHPEIIVEFCTSHGGAVGKYKVFLLETK